MSEHWAVKYIGKPYRVGASGPDAYDCWGLVRKVYEDEFRIFLPIRPVPIEPSVMEKSEAILKNIMVDWEPAFKPFEGAGVAMSKNMVFHHVGVYTEADGGKIIHAWDEHSGVVATSHRDLRLVWRFRNVKYYRHKQWPS